MSVTISYTDDLLVVFSILNLSDTCPHVIKDKNIKHGLKDPTPPIIFPLVTLKFQLT